MASLIQKIAAQKPAAIGLDLVFSEPDRSSLLNIQQTFKHDFGIDVAFDGVPEGLLDNDGYLGVAIARADAVGSNDFYFEFPGVKAHSVMAENIVDDDAIITPAWATTATFVVCLVVGVAMGLGGRDARPRDRCAHQAHAAVRARDRRAVQAQRRASATLTKEYIVLLFLSAPLHDIGKVGVPDHILLKPGRLIPAEFELMKQHAEFGRKIIFSTAQRIERDNFLVIAGEIAATHHEKWDGSGYPNGLAGEDIPLSGRLMAVADIHDALISRRCDKEPFSRTAADLMRAGRGTPFDPAPLDAFFAIEDRIKAIAFQYKDEAETHPEPALTGHSLIDGEPRSECEAVVVPEAMIAA